MRSFGSSDGVMLTTSFNSASDFEPAAMVSIPELIFSLPLHVAITMFCFNCTVLFPIKFVLFIVSNKARNSRKFCLELFFLKSSLLKMELANGFYSIN